MNDDEVNYKEFMKQIVDEFEKRNPNKFPNKFPISTEELNEKIQDDIKEMADYYQNIKSIEKEYYDVYAKEMDQGLNPNVQKIRKDIASYLDNILKSGHGSVLEHATYSFAIEGISKIFSGEMNRHRAGWAISEGSMRYIRFEDIPYWIPPSLQISELDSDELKIKKQKSIDSFKRAFDYIEKEYNELQSIWKQELAPESKFHSKKQITSMMRRIVPIGVAIGGIWIGNIRAIRHVITMRTTEHAEEEICYVFSNIVSYIKV